MSHSWWLPNLVKQKLFEGKPEQVKAWSQIFKIRAQGNMEGRIYYIATKDGAYKVEGTPDFKEWLAAKEYIEQNWRKIYDDLFEDLVLTDE